MPADPRKHPLSESALRGIIAAGESALVEFKQQWYDLGHQEGKALMAKDILALANSVTPDESGFLVIGVDDRGQLVGVEQTPTPETVSNILTNYIQPPTSVSCREYEVGDLKLSVLIVSWSPVRPHHSLRDHPTVLTRNVVYVRRDRTVGTLTLPEVEGMMREKGSHLGPLTGREPIQCGFVQKPDVHAGRSLVARVTNVTTEPVSGVNVMIDVRNVRNPDLFCRARKLYNATLRPGESHEVELQFNEITFYLATFDRENGSRKWTTVREFGSHEGDRWLNITLHVDYRGQDGFIAHMERQITLDG